MNRLGLAAIALLLAGCAPFGPTISGQPVALGVDVELAAGATVTYGAEDLGVTYERLVNDGRCPEDVDCAWEGDATVRVLLARPASGAGTPLDLHTSRTYPRIGDYQRFRVELVKLTRAADRLTVRVTAR